MEPFTTFTALAVPLARVNVDTDQIIPKQFLKLASRETLGKALFNDWRYVDGDWTRPDPGFVLNQPRHRGARVLVAGDNFGCGSSRETAPWALMEYGFRCVISTSFADIFYNNSIKNGLLPAIVSADELAKLMGEVEANEGLEITADLPAQTLRTSTGLEFPFRIEPHVKHSLLKGLDDIAVILQFEEQIAAFERRSRAAFPWLG